MTRKDRTFLTTVALVLGGVLSLLATDCSKDHAPPLNLLLITVDTLRADHLSCYGYEKKTSPRIDRLARDGVLFVNTTCQAPITLPSHASILTGALPIYHRVRLNAVHYLTPEHTTLAEAMKSGGFATAAFVSALVLAPEYGLAQGFDTYDADFTGSILNQVKWTAGKETEPSEQRTTDATGGQSGTFGFERRADETTHAAIQWLTENRDNRFFLWVHYFDPHFPYYLYDETGEKIVDQEGVNVTTGLIYYGNLNKAIDYYDAEIRLTDTSIGQLLDALDRFGLTEETLIVFTADHGEGLGEKNYYYEHEDFLYEPLIHIPLILVWPKGLPRGAKVAERARTIDIVPTVCQLMDIPLPQASQGTSLLPLCLNEPGWDPLSALSETVAPTQRAQSALYSLNYEGWKLVWAPETRGYALYDLNKDPDEENNLCDLSESDPDRFVAEYLPVVRALDTRLKETLRTSAGSDQPNKRELDEKTRHMLKSLGYMH